MIEGISTRIRKHKLEIFFPQFRKSDAIEGIYLFFSPEFCNDFLIPSPNTPCLLLTFFISYYYYNAPKRTKCYQEHLEKYHIMQTLGVNRVYNRVFEKREWENKTCKLIGQETINRSEQLR